MVKGTVLSIDDQKGIKVSLSKNISGICLPLHFADVSIKHPLKKFKLGNVLTLRVLATASKNGKRSLRLTHKKVHCRFLP